MDTATLVAALGHGIVDADDFPPELVAADFGDDVAKLVSDVAELDNLSNVHQSRWQRSVG